MLSLEAKQGQTPSPIHRIGVVSFTMIERLSPILTEISRRKLTLETTATRKWSCEEATTPGSAACGETNKRLLESAKLCWKCSTRLQHSLRETMMGIYSRGVLTLATVACSIHINLH
jgi:hypothetical protein